MTDAQEKGLEIVSDEAFTADSNKDFTVQIQKAQSAGAELVFLPIYYTEASLILTQADKIGYEPVFFGCDGLDGLVSVSYTHLDVYKRQKWFRSMGVLQLRGRTT